MYAMQYLVHTLYTHPHIQVILSLCYCYFLIFQIDALGEVVEAVEGRVEVYLDGGVRQGTDVLKALALGAKAVFIGRPVLWGLAYQVLQMYGLICTVGPLISK